MGWTASADVFGPKGFFDTFLAGDAAPHLLNEGFGAPFRMVNPGVGFKKHPSNYFTHRPIDAALELREEFKIDPRDIDRVEVLFPRFEYVDRPQPRTGLDGKFSVQYTVAIALLDGEVTIDSFTSERQTAPDIAALLPRVVLKFDDAIPRDFDQMHSVVTVRMKDGRQLARKVDKLSGWIGLPLTRQQRLTKFHSCARRVLPKKAAERIVELVEDLERLPDIVELMDLARADK
jgi:aconitate decarboxylase